MPIILGYEYRKYFKVGDEFTVDYLFKEIKVKVSGFLKKDQQLVIGNVKFNLNKVYILFNSG